MRLASNESPYPPLPAVREAIERALGTLNRYPDPSNSLLRAAPQRPLRRARRRGSRSATAPATSCWPPARRCSSPAPSSSTRGRRSRSTRTSRAASGARAITVALDGARAPRPAGDAARDHRRHAAGDRLQPQQPDQHRARRSRTIAAFLERGAAARVRDRRRGLLRVQPARRPRRLDRAARRATRTSCCCAPSRRSTASAGCASASRCAAPRSCRARSTRCASRSSATRSPRPPRSRRSPTRTRSIDRVARTVAERIAVDERPARARARAGRVAGELLLVRARRADATRQAVMRGPAGARRARARRHRARQRAAARCASPTALPEENTPLPRRARRGAGAAPGPSPAASPCRTAIAGALHARIAPWTMRRRLLQPSHGHELSRTRTSRGHRPSAARTRGRLTAPISPGDLARRFGLTRARAGRDGRTGSRSGTERHPPGVPSALLARPRRATSGHAG